ncbi:MAG: hypothetical protein JWN63_805 [Candidatus Acidoferrum typicum]|nr:hypothetical protein [Candidatus Acidoferrum typicum]
MFSNSTVVIGPMFFGSPGKLTPSACRRRYSESMLFVMNAEACGTHISLQRPRACHPAFAASGAGLFSLPIGVIVSSRI